MRPRWCGARKSRRTRARGTRPPTTSGRTCATSRSSCTPAGVQELLLVAHVLPEVVGCLVPRALVLRLFLAPHHLGRIRVALHLGLELLVGEGIELLDANDRRVGPLKLRSFESKVVIDLAVAGDDALHPLLVDARGVGNHGLEGA